MMATRLTDSELAARVRAGNRIRAQRQQEKRRSAGLVQLNVWLSQPIRTALDRAAAHRNMTVSETVSDLLERALSVAMLLDTTTPAPYRCLRCDAPIPADCEDAPVCADCNLEMNAIADACNATTPAIKKPVEGGLDPTGKYLTDHEC